MLKAIFIDHMGTLVYEQSEWLTKLLDLCAENSNEKDTQKIGKLWNQKHDELIQQYNGENYKDEYAIILEAFESIKEQIGLQGDSHQYCDLLIQHLIHTPAYDDTYDFFAQCPLPIYIITNNDSQYVEENMKNLELTPKGIISGQTTHYYKPHQKMFEKALEITKLKPHEAVYIGDSYNKDMQSAKSVGMRAFLIGHKDIQDPEVTCIDTLLDVFEYL